MKEEEKVKVDVVIVVVVVVATVGAEGSKLIPLGPGLAVDPEVAP